jgi:hypothetical protein
MRADLVQEVAVMRDDDDRVFEVDQELLEPVDGRQVQVVGRFVEQQDVGLAEERLREQHLHLFGAGEVGHQFLMQVGTDAQTVQKGGRVRLGFPAVQFGKLALQFGGAHAVCIREVLFHIDRVFFQHDGVETGMAHNHRLEHGVGVKGEVVLLQHRQPLARGDGDLAGLRFDLAGQDLQEGRLAGTVGANEAVAVARRELNVDVFKKLAVAIPEANVRNCNQCRENPFTVFRSGRMPAERPYTNPAYCIILLC